MTYFPPSSDCQDDKFHDECGIFGIYGCQIEGESAQTEAATLTTLGLHALQHRGQEAAGVLSFDGTFFHIYKAAGLVGDSFNDQSILDTLKGENAIGHVRYSTSGEASERNIQPLFAELRFGGFGLAHNGNLTNATTLRQELVANGKIFQSTSDSEVILHLMTLTHENHNNADAFNALCNALRQVQGTWAIVATSGNQLMGGRDPYGVRPLVLGKLRDAWILCSETCALDMIGAEYIRDIEPGEVVLINETGVHSKFPFPAVTPKFCIFEYIYFARPDSSFCGQNVHGVRRRIGAELARENAIDVDIVVPIPDSGISAAIGYAEQSGIPLDLGIIRNHYVGRTFIEPTQNSRDIGVRLKHNANRAVLDGKRVVLIDDSVVRGTTSKKIVNMVRAAGVREVHLCIASPPTTYPCFYGIDTPRRENLMANRFNHDIEAMAREINVDSLRFISMEGLYRAIGDNYTRRKDRRHCDACFTGEYVMDNTDLSCKHSEQLSLLAVDAPNKKIA